MRRRRLLLLLLAPAAAGCGRRGELRLPKREGGEGSGAAPTPMAPPARSAPQRRGPAPAGLETG